MRRVEDVVRTSSSTPAAEVAAAAVAAVRDSPSGRQQLLRSLYEPIAGAPARHVRYRRAATAFLDWQLGRGLLRPPDAPGPGSPWWRAVNERLLRDTGEARALLLGHPGPPSSPSVAASLEFARRPSARRWYRAHNTTIVSAYLDHGDLAADENRVERFFINLVLVRVLYAHALVAAPRLALDWLAPVAPLLGDPRLGMTGIFLSLSRVLPNTYPLAGDLDDYVAVEHGFGRLLDVGIIGPRYATLYAWSAGELGLPATTSLFRDGVPAYAWDPDDRVVWEPAITGWARAALLAVRPRR